MTIITYMMRNNNVLLLLCLCTQWLTLIIRIESTKPPFHWDLNEPGSTYETEGQHSPVTIGTSTNTGDADIIKASEGSSVDWVGRKKRRQTGQADGKQGEGTTWNWKSFSEPPTKKSRTIYKPTLDQKAIYNQRKREKYAAMSEDERKKLITKMLEQKESRFAKLNPQEQEALATRRRTLENQRKLRVRLSKTDEEKLKDKALRKVQNRVQYLRRKARKNQ